MKIIWRTRLEVVDLDTGEVITKSHVERSEYYITKREIRNEKPRKPGLLENLVAMIKRNFNSPELVGVVDIEEN